jgi:hypothetical protein
VLSLLIGDRALAAAAWSGAEFACRVGQWGEPVGHGLQSGVQRVVLAGQFAWVHLVGPDLGRQVGLGRRAAGGCLEAHVCVLLDRVHGLAGD